MKKVIVFMESDVYGYETFKCTNIDGAVTLIKQLWLSCITPNDGIERRIGVIINPGETYN